MQSLAEADIRLRPEGAHVGTGGAPEPSDIIYAKRRLRCTLDVDIPKAEALAKHLYGVNQNAGRSMPHPRIL